MLRSLKPIATPLGNYIRPTRRDHRVLLNLLGEGRLPTSGVVVDPTLWDVHEELGREAASHQMEVILDPQAALGSVHRKDRESSVTYSQAPSGIRVNRRLGA